MPGLGTGAWRVVRISPAGLPVRRGPPLAVWAPRTRVCGDAHKKLRGKTVKGKSIFGIRNFPTEWCVSGAARRAALISSRAVLMSAQRCQRGSPESRQGCPQGCPDVSAGLP